MTSPAASKTPILAFYPPPEPALRYLFEEIAALHPFTGVWLTDAADTFRWLTAGDSLGKVSPGILPFWPWAGEAPRLLRPKLRRLARDHAVVVFTRPDQAALLSWFAASRKVYYAIDDYMTYNSGWRERELALLDAADVVVAVSPRLAEVLSSRSPRVEQRLLVSPNAVPADWIPTGLPPLGAATASRKPRIGIVGRISSRLRLGWLAEVASKTPSFEWQFVGDVEERELLDADRPHLAKLQSLENCVFAGPKPYAELRDYAREVDIAVLPYSERSVNPCASPMRLFIHLAFGTPILATPGCDMLERYDPLVKTCRSADELLSALQALAADGLDDGLREARWREAHKHTWTVRAKTLLPVFLDGAA